MTDPAPAPRGFGQLPIREDFQPNSTRRGIRPARSVQLLHRPHIRHVRRQPLDHSVGLILAASGSLDYQKELPLSPKLDGSGIVSEILRSVEGPQGSI